METIINDGIFEWKGFGNGQGNWESRCYLTIFQNQHSNMYVVVATDIPGDNGTSITNCAEHLANIVFQKYELLPDKVIWIERYLEGSSREKEETFDLVSFQWTGRAFSSPQWKRITRSHAEDLAGAKIPVPVVH